MKLVSKVLDMIFVDIPVIPPGPRSDFAGAGGMGKIFANALEDSATDWNTGVRPI